MEKDISNLEREELIKKYQNMAKFVIKNQAGNNMSDDYIKSNFRKEVYGGKIVFVIDQEKNIKLETTKCDIYRDENNKILMIETSEFKVLS